MLKLLEPPPPPVSRLPSPENIALLAVLMTEQGMDAGLLRSQSHVAGRWAAAVADAMEASRLPRVLRSVP